MKPIIPVMRQALEAIQELHKGEVVAVHEGYGPEVACMICREHTPCPTLALVDRALGGGERG